MILHIVKILKVLKILIRIFSLLFYFVVFYFARWRRREETAIESVKTKVKPKGYCLLACITAHILATIVPSMYAVTYIASDVYSPPGYSAFARLP